MPPKAAPKDGEAVLKLFSAVEGDVARKLPPGAEETEPKAAWALNGLPPEVKLLGSGWP